MKKIFVSVGLAAVGAAGLPTAFAQGMEAGATPKIWNVAANLRGFYDDNYAVANNKTGSFGFEFTPSISANVALKQTDIGVKYTFGMFYYLQRADNGMDPMDYSHQGDFWLDHTFNERFKINLSDSLAIGQDPKLVQGGAVVRVQGNNVANHATATLNSQWTRQFSTATHYGNNLFIYSNGGTNSPSNPSDAAQLNRMEQSVGTDFQWHFQPETMGFVGYNFTWVRYNGNAQIASPFILINPPKAPRTIHYYSDARDNNAHYGYVGVQHEFSPNLSSSLKAGVSETDMYNDPVSPSTSLAPYVDFSATYTYIPGCYVQVGVTQDQNATDVVTPGANGHLTQYQQTSVFYMDVNHRFTPKLSASLNTQYQYSTYKDGAYSNDTGDSSISTGINLNYQINRNLSAQAGYTFDELFSSINGRGNSRNTVYLGLGANY